MAKTDTIKHLLIPKHVKISDKEKKELFEKLNISSNELPKINKKDPGIVNLDVKVGDVIKITRKSHTAEEAFFYRSVTNV